MWLDLIEWGYGGGNVEKVDILDLVISTSHGWSQ